MSWSPQLTARRIAENESRVRASNERIRSIAQRVEHDGAPMTFICECGRLECVEPIRVPLADYESVREHSRLFLCLPGHQLTGEDLGRVVRFDDGYVVVEKIGRSGEVAERLDAREGDPGE